MITLVARGMVDAFHEAWDVLKAKTRWTETPTGRKTFGSTFEDQFYTHRRNNEAAIDDPDIPDFDKDAVDARYKELGPQNWMSSFTNKDGKPTKRRWPGTPTWDKSRSIMDEYNLTGPNRTPMGTEGSMTDEDEQFMSQFRIDPEVMQPQSGGNNNQQSEAEKHGLSEEQYDDWQRRLAAIMDTQRGGSAAPN